MNYAVFLRYYPQEWPKTTIFSSPQPSAKMTVALNNLVNTSTGVKEYNVDMAGAIIAALPTLLVYVLAGQYFVRGLTAGAIKG